MKFRKLKLLSNAGFGVELTFHSPLLLYNPQLFWWSDHICFRQEAC